MIILIQKGSISHVNAETIDTDNKPYNTKTRNRDNSNHKKLASSHTIDNYIHTTVQTKPTEPHSISHRHARAGIFTFHVSPRVCPSTAGCSPPSKPSIVFCLLFPVPGGSLLPNRLVDLVVRRPPRERKIPGSNPAGGGIFSGSSHTSDIKIGTPVATLPGAWRYTVSTGTGRPGVSIL